MPSDLSRSLPSPCPYKRARLFHGSPTGPPHQRHPRQPGSWIAEFEYSRRFQHWRLEQNSQRLWHIYFEYTTTSKTTSLSPLISLLELQHVLGQGLTKLTSIKHIHLFTQLGWLEHEFPRFVRDLLRTPPTTPFLFRLEHLNITIRRSDWWWNELNHPLGINPFSERGGGDPKFVLTMLNDIAAQGRGENVPCLGWGGAFKFLPALKKLTMEFETVEDKRTEWLGILRWARIWRFELSDGKCLAAAGKVDVREWRAPMGGWSDICGSCGAEGTCRVVTVGSGDRQVAEGWKERTRLRGFGAGTDVLCLYFEMEGCGG